MPELPPLDALRVFEAAARLGSFNAAAEELNLSPSAVSHRMRGLEDFLGVALFDRRNRRVEATEAGLAYAAAVRGALETLRAATRRLASDRRARPLTLSLAPAFAARWLVPRLGRFQARHPDIELRFATNSRLAAFGDGDVDAAVRYGTGDWPDLVTELLMNVDALPVCAPQLLTDGPSLVVPQDVAHHIRVHVTARPDDWRMWFVAAGVRDVDPTVGPAFEDLPTALEAVAGGFGLVIADRQIIAQDLTSGRLVAPFDIDMPSQGAFYFVCPPANAEDARVVAFRDWLVGEIGDARGAAT
jgi:LysR family glycine cleavage system transcriptional activator